MLEKILKSVTDAEANADTMIRDAQENAKQMVEEARRRAALLKESTVKELKIRQQEQSKQMQMVTHQKLEAAVGEAEQEAKKLKASVEMKKQAAIDAVIGRMV